jgi:hypothetical protein
MELLHLHAMEPLDADVVASALAPSWPPESLDPRGGLSVRFAGPWRPADRWAGSLERLVWSAEFRTLRDRFAREEVLPTLHRKGLARRWGGVHPGEALARSLGGALLVDWSDARGRMEVTVYRERRLRWSVCLDGDERLIRCDGEALTVDEPVRWYPEGDRTGLLLAGLGQFLRVPLGVDPETQLTLPDALDSLFDGAPSEPLLREGRWVRRRSAQLGA